MSEKPKTQDVAMGATVKFYKNGDGMAITTDATEEREFLSAASAALAEMVDTGLFCGDWEFQFGYWLPQIVDIVCKLRGYKSSVHEIRLIAAGHMPPDDAELVMGEDRRGASFPGDRYAEAIREGRERRDAELAADLEALAQS